MNQIQTFVDRLEVHSDFKTVEWFIKKHDVAKKNRCASAVALRQLVALEIFKHKKVTLEQIGKMLNQHHSTVIYSINTANNRIEQKDPLFMEVIKTHRPDLNAINWEN